MKWEWEGGGWKHTQVGDDNASEGGVEISRPGEAREIWVAAVVVIGHVHPAVEHYPLPVHRHYHAALPDLLPSAWNRNRKQKVGFKNVIRDRENSEGKGGSGNTEDETLYRHGGIFSLWKNKKEP